MAKNDGSIGEYPWLDNPQTRAEVCSRNSTKVTPSRVGWGVGALGEQQR